MGKRNFNIIYLVFAGSGALSCSCCIPSGASAHLRWEAPCAPLCFQLCIQPRRLLAETSVLSYEDIGHMIYIISCPIPTRFDSCQITSAVQDTKALLGPGQSINPQKRNISDVVQQGHRP